jgi:hypothetical protein
MSSTVKQRAISGMSGAAATKLSTESESTDVMRSHQ